eukprot:TRINITY_DN4240_c0_g1_i4.p1 TRINITY_DN4240_c0_g1~~TRINITY_DN4240_c0_g1_i4.p1  ORF type:complete len:197 (-),score=33.89 TRINITY_DN4240_c0_g1_i4:236-826(-)
MMVPSSPVIFPCDAEHIFCETCVATQTKCPNCREERDGRQLKPLKGVALRTFNNLQLKCERGCGKWKGTVADMKQHTNTSCEKSAVKCENIGCEKYYNREDITTHQKLCENRAENCQQCNETMQYKQLTEHNTICPRAIIHCAEGGRNCKQYERRNEEQHKKQCEYQIVRCAWQQYGCQHICQRNQLEVYFMELFL